MKAVLGHPGRLWIIGAFLALASAPEARAQEGFRAWVGLYHPNQLAWLENENRLGELCGSTNAIPECHRVMLEPAVQVYPLHQGPGESSARIGDLIVAAVPGRGLTSLFRSADSSAGVRFSPDLFLQDWFYGPYFHQTLLQQRGSWFRLPPDPWEETVWVRLGVGGGESTVLGINAGDIIEMEGGGFYVVSAEADALVLRPEQPGDFWCLEGDPPPIVSSEPVRFSRPELSDARGHLKFRRKYLKGC